MTAPSHTSTLTPGFFTTFDSTMLGTLKECPRKFYFQHILGFQPPRTNVHLTFGQLYHAGLERYDHSRAAGLSHEDASTAMVEWAMKESAGWVSDDPIKNRTSLIRSLVWAAEDEQHSPLQTVILANGKPAVELSFRFPAFEAGGETIYLSGHLDKVAKHESQSWIVDRKTTAGPLNATYFRQFNPHNQMTLYTIAGRVILAKPPAGVLIAAAQIGVNFTRTATRPTLRAPAALDEWMADTQWWINRAHEFAVQGHWPANDKSCGNYGGCPFIPVCSVAPAFRKRWLADDYIKFDWNPLKIRGDI